MLKTVLFVILIMSSLLIVLLLLIAQFVPAVEAFLFGPSKLECKPCICHPECHCETKCIQQQIMKDCNLGVDSHNLLASHHTQENRTTRIILIFSLIVNFILTLLLLFRKTVRNCYRAQQLRKRLRTEATLKKKKVRYETKKRFRDLKRILNLFLVSYE
jgi:hypothetical protein